MNCSVTIYNGIDQKLKIEPDFSALEAPQSLIREYFQKKKYLHSREKKN